MSEKLENLCMSFLKAPNNNIFCGENTTQEFKRDKTTLLTLGSDENFKNSYFQSEKNLKDYNSGIQNATEKEKIVGGFKLFYYQYKQAKFKIEERGQNKYIRKIKDTNNIQNILKAIVNAPKKD